MRPAVSIIVPAHNQLAYCRQCIGSIQAHTDTPHKLILVDNGSTDGVSEFFDAVPGATVVHAQTNRGFPGGVNLGLAHAEGHVLLLNSDTIVPQGWLGRLLAALESAKRVGMVGPMSNYVSGPQRIEGLEFGSIDEINAYARQRSETGKGRLLDVDRLVGFCLLIRDSAFEHAGLFDETFGIGNFEDDDYCIRVRRAGYRLCIAEDCFVFHYGSRTFQGMGFDARKLDALLEENEARFKAKWRLQDTGATHTTQVSRQLNREARACFERGDATGALRLLKDAVAACPILEQNYNDLGAVLWSLGERERAFEHFARAVRLNPSYNEALENLRDAAAALGKPVGTEDLLADTRPSE